MIREPLRNEDKITEKVIGRRLRCIAIWGRDCWNQRIKDVWLTK